MFGNSSTKQTRQGKPDDPFCALCKAFRTRMPSGILACQTCDWPSRWPRFLRKGQSPDNHPQEGA